MQKGDHDRCPSPGCAEEAAHQAAKKVFAVIGVDLDVPQEVERFRDLLRFVKSAQTVAGRGAMAGLVALVTIIVGYVMAKLGWGPQ